MHGLIFTSFRDYVASEHGPDTVSALFDGRPRHLVSEAYPDEELHRLVGAAAQHSGKTDEELVREFGVFTGERTFPRLYPAYYALAGDTRAFLLSVETLIHELVRATLPQAAPPRLRVSELGEDGVQITYSSPRKLCRLLRGLTDGTARRFDESATITEPECMLDGAEACRLEVRLQPTTRATDAPE
jgi:hypothetical protein